MITYSLTNGVSLYTIHGMKLDGDNLRKLLDEKDLSIVEVAQAADLNPQTLYRTTGKKELSRKSLRKLTAAIDQLRPMHRASKAIS